MTPPAIEQSAIEVGYRAPFEVRTRISRQPSGWTKRGFDASVATFLLLATLPLFALIALAIKLDSRGPVFFRARRVGYRGAPLWMLKFRKMHADAKGGPLTVAGDPRLTRVGALLTRTRLDELPQLWDVLRGRMSIIGPRPEDPEFVALHMNDYARILLVRPGMTGVTQLAYADESQILDQDDPVGDYLSRVLPEKIRLDKLYVESHRITLDLSILWWTIVAVVFRRSISVHRSTCRMTVRRRAAQPGSEATPATETA